jgi:shikimate 5-dehydrogenase
VRTGSSDPAEHDLVVNATPMGMNEGDALPMDVSRISSDAFVGEVVMKTEMTAFLQAAKNRGCRVQGVQICCLNKFLRTWNTLACPPQRLKCCAMSHN